MKQDTLNKIIRREKTEINIDGYIYNIHIEDGYVILEAEIGFDSDASSLISMDTYAYTHGGKIYRKAVQAAWEIEEAYRKELAKHSDV